MHLSDEPVLKRSNSQPIQLNFHSPDGDVISSSPRHSPDPSNCSLLSSPPISGYDVIRSSGRLSCSSSSPDVNEISSPPCIKKHQQRLRLCNHPVTVTPLRHNRPELNPHSTPIGQINAIRLSGNFATPQDALKWCRKKFYRYPDREDEWNVSMKATDDVLRQFWKVFHASNLRNSPPNLLSAIPASSLAIVFSYLETFERPTVQLVCRHWCLSLHYLLAQEMCLLPTDSGLCNEGVPFVNSIDWQDHFTSYFTDISLVGDGTSKRVFSLLLDPSHRHDMTMTTTSPLISDFNTTMAALTTFTNPVVVSVMDLEDLFSREVSRQTIEAELQISLLCSSLYSLRICPCLLQTHFFFRSDQLLHENANFKTRHKRQKGKRRKSEILRNSREEGRYLYIGMEKCNGNLEEYLEAISSEQKEYSVTSIIAIFFQLCYALYVCREKMALVHYDLKLLNCLYLLADNTSSMTVEEMKSKKNGKYISKASHIAGSQSDIEMKIGFEDRMYSIPLSSSLHSTCGIVKLIDFGTSVMHNTNLGKPIQIQQV